MSRCTDLTHSKVMAWVVLDRAVKEVEWFGLDGWGGGGHQILSRRADSGTRAPV